MRRSFVIACLLLWGCGAGLVVTGDIRSAEGPIHGADVAMDCPQAIEASGPSRLTSSDAVGHVEFREPAGGRWIHDDCQLIVTMPGYQPSRTPVGEVCQKYDGERCTRVALAAQLEPVGIEPAIPKDQALELDLIITVNGKPLQRKQMTVQLGQPTTIEARSEGLRYQIIIVPRREGASGIALSGDWSVADGRSGTIAQTVVAGAPTMIVLEGTNVMVHLTARRARD